MLNPTSPLARLLAVPPRAGHVERIGLRPVRRAALTFVEAAELVPGMGLVGDHYASRTDGPRQVTLIEVEDLAAIASYLGMAAVDAGILRRNILVRGLNLRSLKEARFRIGETVLEATGECHPCSRMEDALGAGGYQAVRGHGGITARVLTSGRITIGDPVQALGGSGAAR